MDSLLGILSTFPSYPVYVLAAIPKSSQAVERELTTKRNEITTPQQHIQRDSPTPYGTSDLEKGSRMIGKLPMDESL